MSIEPGSGTCVGEAQIVREISRGASGIVYEVLWRGARAALKLSTPREGASHPWGRALKEIEALSMLSHPHVVRWLHADLHHGVPYLVLEYVDGKTLREILLATGGPLPVERALYLMRQVCAALAAVHQRDLIHRDLCPENILVTGDDLVKVTDFDTVKLPGVGVATTDALAVGRLLYAPPERWQRGNVPTAKGDVHTIGQITYELLLGAHPDHHDGPGLLSVSAAKMSRDPPPLSSVRPDVSRELSDLLACAMARAPEARCSAHELEIAMGEVLYHLEAPRRRAARSVPRRAALEEVDAYCPTLPMIEDAGPWVKEGPVGAPGNAAGAGSAKAAPVGGRDASPSHGMPSGLAAPDAPPRPLATPSGLAARDAPARPLATPSGLTAPDAPPRPLATPSGLAPRDAPPRPLETPSGLAARDAPPRALAHGEEHTEPEPRGPRGTMLLPTAPAPAPAGSEDRAASLPPPSHAVPSSIPTTLRVFSRPPPPLPPPLPPTVPTPAPPALEEARRSTAAPVESASRPVLATGRRRWTHVAAGSVVAVALAGAAGWTLRGAGMPAPEPRPAAAPPPSASVPASASASAPGPGSAAAQGAVPRPTTSAAVGKKAGAAPRGGKR